MNCAKILFSFTALLSVSCGSPDSKKTESKTNSMVSKSGNILLGARHPGGGICVFGQTLEEEELKVISPKPLSKNELMKALSEESYRRSIAKGMLHSVFGSAVGIPLAVVVSYDSDAFYDLLDAGEHIVPLVVGGISFLAVNIHSMKKKSNEKQADTAQDAEHDNKQQQLPHESAKKEKPPKDKTETLVGGGLLLASGIATGAAFAMGAPGAFVIGTAATAMAGGAAAFGKLEQHRRSANFKKINSVEQFQITDDKYHQILERMSSLPKKPTETKDCKTVASRLQEL